MTDLLEFGTGDQLQLNALLGGRAFTSSSPDRLVGFSSFGTEVRPGVMAYDRDFLYAWADYQNKDRAQLDAILSDLDPRAATNFNGGQPEYGVGPDGLNPQHPTTSSTGQLGVGLVVAAAVAWLGFR